MKCIRIKGMKFDEKNEINIYERKGNERYIFMIEMKGMYIYLRDERYMYERNEMFIYIKGMNGIYI